MHFIISASFELFRFDSFVRKIVGGNNDFGGEITFNGKFMIPFLNIIHEGWVSDVVQNSTVDS